MIDNVIAQETQINTSLKIAWLYLVIFAFAILALGEFSFIDLIIEDYYYDPVLKTFPWKNTWFANDFMHIYLKNIILVCALTLYLVLILDIFKPIVFTDSLLRIRLWFVATASIVIPLTVNIIKRHSALHCPWDIDRYHGTAPFLKLLEHIPDGVDPGACFPAGHATSGLWLASLCIFWLPVNPKKSLYVFLCGLCFGFALGWVQQMRGAHFLFHTLWSMWIASLAILLMLQIFKAAVANSYRNFTDSIRKLCLHKEHDAN